MTDDMSEPQSWQTALAHSPTIFCSCCGVQAHDCHIFASAQAEQLADSQSGGGDLPYAEEVMS